jgi:hypothetical protein
MSLRALRKHRHLPAAAALMSVLLYTAFVTSHIVSQATHRSLPAQGADIHTVVTAESGCHDSSSLAGNAHHPSRGDPVSPPRKCPFCVGYAALHITVVVGSMSILPVEAVAQSFESLGRAQLIFPASLPSWHPRAPPALG